MPEINKSPDEERVEIRPRLPEGLHGKFKATKDQMNTSQHSLGHFVFGEWVSEHWEGKVVPYEHKEKLIRFSRDAGNSSDETKLMRIRLPKSLVGKIKAAADQMNISLHELAQFVFDEWLSEHWEGRVIPREYREKLVQFVGGDKS